MNIEIQGSPRTAAGSPPPRHGHPSPRRLAPAGGGTRRSPAWCAPQRRGRERDPRPADSGAGAASSGPTGARAPAGTPYRRDGQRARPYAAHRNSGKTPSRGRRRERGDRTRSSWPLASSPARTSAGMPASTDKSPGYIVCGNGDAGKRGWLFGLRERDGVQGRAGSKNSGVGMTESTLIRTIVGGRRRFDRGSRSGAACCNGTPRRRIGCCRP